MTRITSPAATQSISSPGRILYRSAIALGTVTWYLDVTLTIRLAGMRFILTIARTESLFNEGPVPCTTTTPAAAVNGRADVLVTFNLRDFGRVPAQFGVEALLPREAIGRIRR